MTVGVDAITGSDDVDMGSCSFRAMIASGSKVEEAPSRRSHTSDRDGSISVTTYMPPVLSDEFCEVQFSGL